VAELVTRAGRKRKPLRPRARKPGAPTYGAEYTHQKLRRYNAFVVEQDPPPLIVLAVALVLFTIWVLVIRHPNAGESRPPVRAL
jgi:hypothetical protein